ncbi:MAG: ankyrin repeat domain-containing protein, partial [Proteobacteria bacterium]|nr:ankyrin repeat domain-containing protein [Pseudomonadota bacterium]
MLFLTLLPPITGTTTNSVLILAIGLNFTAIAQTLIAAKANVHFQNSQGQTALTEAANHGNLELVNSLIAAKANVNIQESTGATALIYAADKGNLPLVNILLAAGANPNLQTNAANGSTTAL